MLPSESELTLRESSSLEPPRPIFDRLPEFYRENPELLAPLIDAAEDMVAELVSRLSRRESAEVLRKPWSLEVDERTASCGTIESICQLFKEELSVVPFVWNGLEAQEHTAGGLHFRRAERRAAVLALEKSQLGELPPGFILPLETIPVDARLQIVALGRLPRRGAPHPGERFAGQILGCWSGDAGEGVSRWM